MGRPGAVQNEPENIPWTLDDCEIQDLLSHRARSVGGFCLVFLDLFCRSRHGDRQEFYPLPEF